MVADLPNNLQSSIIGYEEMPQYPLLKTGGENK